MLQYWWMIPLGFALGLLGTMIGAGGGFLLVPLLLLLYPHAEPETITSISLAVVCANASAGSLSYARMKRIDFRSGLLFAAASVPGAILGAFATQWLPRSTFDILFGATLIILASALLWKSTRPRPPAPTSLGLTPDTHRLGTYSLRTGLAISAGVGFISSVLGVGGGIMHVPALVYILDFPVHIATATSHFVLAITAAVGTIVHLATGAFEHGARRAIMLTIGVVLGAPLGARLSKKVGDRWIVRALATALLLAGFRLIVLGVSGHPTPGNVPPPAPQPAAIPVQATQRAR